MREWSSGAQTDFTNYAARRLSERGMLREDDPIKLQRAVTEIAYGYAKGGSVGENFVPADNPLAPNHSLPQSLGWTSSALRDDFDRESRSGNADVVRTQSATNEARLSDRQSQQRVTPQQAVGNDLATRISSAASQASETVESHRRDVSQAQGNLSEDYNATVQTGKLSPHHSGNRAVWDAVGAQTENRANVGKPPATPTVGEWHHDKDGVPSAGSTPASALPEKTSKQTARPETPENASHPKGNGESR
jgi:hypothetical protein